MKKRRKKPRDVLAKSGKRFIGAYLEEEAAAHLFLLTLVRKTSRAKMIEQYLLRELSTAPSTVELCEALATRFAQEWMQTNGTAWVTYTKRVRESLRRKKIPDKLANVIVARMEGKRDATESATG